MTKLINLLFMFILLTSSQAVAKKIVLDCVAEKTHMFKTMTFDYSLTGRKQKLIIDTSDEIILFGGSKYDLDFVESDSGFAASDMMIEEDNTHYRLAVKSTGSASNIISTKGEPLWMDMWSCEAGKSLW
jgi:hypothetical protein